MHSPAISAASFRLPTFGPGLRSTLTQFAGTFVIGAMCAVVVARAVALSGSRSDGATALGVLGAVAVVISVLRWVPSSPEPRPLPRTHAAMLLAGCLVVASIATLSSPARNVVFGPLATLSLTSAYLACWGYRSLFLLRRVVLFSVLTWSSVADATIRVLNGAVESASDLTYRRLSSGDFSQAGEHPWRVLTAMADRGTIAVAAVLVLTVAATRVRLSLTVIARTLLGVAVALAVHHTVLLTVALESYTPTAWTRFVAGPLFELAIGTVIAAFLAIWLSRLTTAEKVNAHIADRDPEIFGAHNIRRPVAVLRIGIVAFPTMLLAAVAISP